jgi:hypothetical protein
MGSLVSHARNAIVGKMEMTVNSLKQITFTTSCVWVGQLTPHLNIVVGDDRCTMEHVCVYTVYTLHSLMMVLNTLRYRALLRL